jgi:four helix bundle suffix protein
VARSSLEELLNDYLDFLRVRDHEVWKKESRQASFARALARKRPVGFGHYREFVESRPPETVANIAVCLLHQTNYLLDQQLRKLEADFVKEGGIRERMTRARLRERGGGGRNSRD